MASPLRCIPALGAFFVLATVLAACGGIPGNAVVRVDDSVIKRNAFDHWMQVAAASSQPPGQGAVAVPDPPSFTRCVAAKRRSTPPPPRGRPQITDAQLQAQCRQEYEGLRDQVLQFLIQAQWLQGEAEDQGIEVSSKEVQRSFEQQKRQSFPSEADYRRFLRTSGMTQQDILLRVRLDLVSNKIRDKVIRAKGRVTEKQIADYYNRNKRQFSQPERRDVEVVLTKTSARAQQAKQAIQGGTPWPSVARTYSIDQTSKGRGGRLSDVTPGQQERAFDTAVFQAPRGRLEGPVKTQFGYYVFRVTRVVPGSQQSLEQVRNTIRQVLISQNQEQALRRFVTQFQKKWKARTTCREGYIIDSCKNAPPRKRTSTVPPGAVPPQGGQPQGAPPQGPPPQGPPPQGAPPQGAPPQGGGSQGAPPSGP
ncbi:MAG TPA: peptidyl-prolyl cis-trans isomerase [Solirubrobacteraceae bacterium]|nr:peptidyl-prolyl cis-trans isomerase [Solirubrobacteraceae bacterium]